VDTATNDAKQTRRSGVRNLAAAGLMNFGWVSNVGIVFGIIFFIIQFPFIWF
jgi:hypothetical protein